jgi:hypothetical protein
LSALIDRRSPRSVTQVLGDYEASRAVYASHAEGLRNAIVEKQEAEQAMERLKPRREELHEATRSLPDQNILHKARNAVDRHHGTLDKKVSDLRATIPISEDGVERMFIRAEENLQRVCAAFEKNAVQFGKGPLDQAQLRISAGRASLNQYALESFSRPLAAPRRAMDALAQSQNPRSQAQPATQPPAPVQPQPRTRLQPQRLDVAENAPPPRTDMQSGFGATLRNAVPWNWRRRPEPEFEMVTPPPAPPQPPAPVQPQPQLQPQPRTRLQPQRLEVAENAVAESSRGRQRPQLRNHRDSASLPRTQPIKAQQRPDMPARSSAESSPPRKPGPKVSL